MTATRPSKKLYRSNSFQESEDSPFRSTVRPPAVFIPESEKVLQETIPKFKESSRYTQKTQPQNPNLLPVGKRLERTLKFYENVYKDREMQMQINEQRKIAQKKDEEYWVELEKKQMVENQESLKEIQRQKREYQKQLAQEYRRQWEEKTYLKKQEKLQEEKDYKEFLQKLKRDEEAEKQRITRIKSDHAQKKNEFKDYYDDVLRRREKEKDQENTREHEYQEDFKKTEEIRRRRKVNEIQRFNEKNRRRDKLLDRVSRQLTQKQRSVSEIKERKVMNPEEEEDKGEKLSDETEETSKSDVPETEEEMRKRTQKQLAKFQLAQVEERKSRNKAEHDWTFNDHYTSFILGPDSY